MSRWARVSGAFHCTQLIDLYEDDAPRGSEGGLRFYTDEHGVVFDENLRDCAWEDDLIEARAWFVRVTEQLAITRACLQITTDDLFVLALHYVKDGPFVTWHIPDGFIDLDTTIANPNDILASD